MTTTKEISIGDIHTRAQASEEGFKGESMSLNVGPSLADDTWRFTPEDGAGW